MIKTIALGFFVLTSLTLGGLLVQEKQQTAQQSARVAELQTQVAKQHDEIQKTTAAAAVLEQKRSQLLARTKAVKQALQEARTAATAQAAATDSATADADRALNPAGKPKTPANPFNGSLAKMMKDPAMKNMMRATQSTTIRQMYGDLVKQWALSPEETNTFYDLLLDKQMDQMDQGMAFLEKGPDAVKAAAPADLDAKLKASLGDDLYKQYQDYQKTLGSRLAVNQYQQQLAVSNAPALTADQSRSLLQAITEEQANMPPGSFFGSAGPGASPLSTDPAQMDQYIKGQGELNDKVAARMTGTLSADQLQVLKDQQQQMLATQRTMMEMTAKMMAPSPTP